MHYGNPADLPAARAGPPIWVTAGRPKRRRGPGHDWSIVRLARRGVIERIELDTDHYKGNAPGHCMLEYTDARRSFKPDKARWQSAPAQDTRSSPTPGTAGSAPRAKPATHVRLNIYPDGGVARLRLFGRAES